MSTPAQAYEWVEIADGGLPTEEGWYIVFAESADPDRPLLTQVFYDQEQGWGLVDAWKNAVTHWCSLPSRPYPKTERPN